MITKKMAISLSCVVLCFCFAPLLALYFLAPNSEIYESTKEYYIKKSFVYFEDNNLTKVSLDDLIKNGYAEYIPNFKKSSCDRKTSFITKNNNIYNIEFICKGYTTDLKVCVNGEISEY